MKPRVLLIIVSIGLLVTTVAVVGKQRQQLHKLRHEAQELQSQVEALPTNTTPEIAAPAPTASASYSGPPLELLRLRSQVGQLERRKQELASVRAENKRLQTEIATKPAGRSGSGMLPAGYLRRAEAKNLGFNSPEDALQSFLWGIEHRDLPTVMKFFGPEEAKQMATRLEREGSTDEFWKEAGVVPGLQVTDRKQQDDGTVALTVQIIPNDDSAVSKMLFKQFDGQWRIISGF
ncbi:MAG: hypothetical protein QM813_09510 [Verrucomicrobiota bacterium]